MAAPHVSGAAALLLSRHRELIGQPRRVKEILCGTATDLGREPRFQGAGMVDVLRAHPVDLNGDCTDAICARSPPGERRRLPAAALRRGGGDAVARVLIDGGSRGIYKNVLKPRLDALRGQDPLDLRMVDRQPHRRGPHHRHRRLVQGPERAAERRRRSVLPGPHALAQRVRAGARRGASDRGGGDRGAPLAAR